MTRAKASALILVNWKGVFFERYVLDPHVTALEGANGAGKTTVMIAAYLVLLPDLSRLRFTNVGETGATGGDRGIWGRLGEVGRPSYSVLQVDLPTSERLAIGVMLERKSEPSLEAITFLISPLRSGVRLSEVLLRRCGDHDEVPTLDEVRDAARTAGAELKVFKNLKEYFTTLFELGCSPMRLVSDEDRNKFNEMLRTSMTGGISRALTSELRSFVLKEEVGLGDALGRMRANLSTCRRTRLEVSEARQLEHELSGIHDAAQRMAAAAQAATRAEANEALVGVDHARRELESSQDRVSALRTTAEQAEARQQTITERLAAARTQVERAGLVKARILRAREAAARLREQLREASELRRLADESRLRQAKASATRAAAKREREGTQEAFRQTAEGLADLQTGLDELHRQAHAHRLVHQKLQQAREALDDPGLDEHTLADAAQRVQNELESIDAERARRDREGQLLGRRRSDYEQASAALQALGGLDGDGARDPERDHDRARHILADLNELETLSQRTRELASEKLRRDAQVERQHGLLAQTKALGIDAAAPTLSRAIQEAQQEAEQRLMRWEKEHREAIESIALAQQEQEHSRRELGELSRRAESWSAIAAAEQHLSRHAGPFEKSCAGVTELVTRLEAGLDDLRAKRRASELELERVKEQAREHENGLGTIPHEIRSAADEVEGELLASRFEDLDVDEAGIMEARLGPLAEAIVVDDPVAAAQRMRDRTHGEATIWLLAADAELPVADSATPPAHSGRLVVRGPGHLRLTRVPERPRLGRAARERNIVQLRGSVEELAASVEQASRSLRTTEASLRAARCLLNLCDPWLAGDPRPLVGAAHERLQAAIEAERQHGQTVHERRELAATERARLAVLRAIARDAESLGDADHVAEAARLARRLEEATAAQERLAVVAGPRSVLRALADCLRYPPPDPSEMDAWTRDRERIDAARDRCYRLSEALEAVRSNRQAFAWGDAERILRERSELVPELRAQHDRTRELLLKADEAVTIAEQAWENATAEWQQADAAASAVQALVERTRLELESEGAAHHSDEALVEANVELARHEQTLAILMEEERGLAADVAIANERATQSEGVAENCRVLLEQAEQRSKPALEAWKSFQDALETSAGASLRTADVQAPAHAERSSDGPADPAPLPRLRHSHDYWPEARSKADLLIDRLEAARGGLDLAQRLRGQLPNDPAVATEGGIHFLNAWIEVREFLLRRLPAQVADVSDPRDALERLRDDLEHLERRLARQETDLGGASEDVGRGIEVQIRRASGQVRRLNQYLEGISFGSIRGIRARMKRVEKMEQVLRALHEGAAQELLFQPTMPIEEALEEIFKRYAAGRGGGQRLLDYREYIELSVEIQRRTSDDWEPANPTRLSTGEAIGVGAALMMVILTEWERDANLLRAKQRRQSLRFLFLDEANRLSHDNLAVLFELCRNLDLQLLIAAPEVAQAEGNTTYRLTRRITSDGMEEVVVSGRRSTLPAELDTFIEAAECPASTADAIDEGTGERAPDRPGQRQLF